MAFQKPRGVARLTVLNLGAESLCFRKTWCGGGDGLRNRRLLRKMKEEKNMACSTARRSTTALSRFAKRETGWRAQDTAAFRIHLHQKVTTTSWYD